MLTKGPIAPHQRRNSIYARGVCSATGSFVVFPSLRRRTYPDLFTAGQQLPPDRAHSIQYWLNARRGFHQCLSVTFHWLGGRWRLRETSWCLTFDGVAEGVDAESDGDEEGENLFGGSGGPSHQARNVEQRVEDEEEGRPKAYAAVHGVEIQLEVFANAVDHCRSQRKQYIYISHYQTVDRKGKRFPFEKERKKERNGM